MRFKLTEQSRASGSPAGAVGILCNHNLRSWMDASHRGTVAGGLGPYGFEHLGAHGFDVVWSDAHYKRPWAGNAARRINARVEWTRPEMAGWMTAGLATRTLGRADVVLAFFEDQGLGYSRLRALHQGLGDAPLILVVCWLAQRGRDLSAVDRGRVARALRGADGLVVFSQNQAEALMDMFGVEQDAIHCVRFGVDDVFFSPSAPKATGGQSGVLFVGRDKSRDLETLLAAAPKIDGRITLLTSREMVANVSLPRNVTATTDVDHLTYRQALAAAGVVCIPTHAPAYPGGQTVILEAMAMAKPVVTTWSEAIVDYVDDRRTGVLVARGDPSALAEAVNALVVDDGRARGIGSAARLVVADQFNHRTMWAQFAEVIDTVLDTRSCGR